MLQTKVAPQHRARDRCAQFAPILKGVVEVNAGIHSRPEDFIDPIAGIFEGMGVNPVLKRRAIEYEVNLRGTKVACKSSRDRAGDGAMRRRIFGVIRRRGQREP